MGIDLDKILYEFDEYMDYHHDQIPSGTQSPVTLKPGQTNPYDSTDPNVLAKKALGNKIPNFAVECSIGRLYDWQKRIISELKQKKDLFVIAPPAGGKTTPVRCYYLRNILFNLADGTDFIDFIHTQYNNKFSMVSNFNTANLNVSKKNENFIEFIHNLIFYPENIPKLVFAVPIRTLANELYKDFTFFLNDLLLYYFEMLFDYKYRTHVVIDLTPLIDRILSLHSPFPGITSIFLNILGHIQKGSRLTDKIDGVPLESLINEISKKIICSRTGGAVMGGHPKYSPIIFMTVDKLAEEIKNISNPALIIFDEAHLFVASHPDFQRYDQSEALRQMNSLDKILTSCPKSQLVFLSGTIGPKSVENFIHSIKIVYDRKNFESSVNSEAKNKTELIVIKDDNLYDPDYVVQLIVNAVKRNDTGSAFIVFSKNKIDEIIYKAKKKLNPNTVENFGGPKQNNYGGGPIFTNHNFKNQPSRMDRLDSIYKYKNETEIQHIKNKEVRDAALHGIGYIYRSDKSSGDGREEFSENDKMIIADLFSKGKLPVLISTTSIGIGVNVSIRKMHLATLMKMESLPGGVKQQQIIGFRDLAQLIHRTGRGKFDKGLVYTPEAYIDEILKALNVTIEDFDKEGTLPFVTIEGLPFEVAKKKIKEALLNVFKKK